MPIQSESLSRSWLEAILVAAFVEVPLRTTPDRCSNAVSMQDFGASGRVYTPA
ncbi:MULTISPECIES: hypothetical protein [unclassified Microcoleus]|uniref:hypothetical protein n=1 Tax=unclassified Microcoleus TaxID=2642155 RepID=UPI002FD6291E